MKRFYLTGQRSFANRGCEAIVRSTVGLLQAKFGSVEVMVPTDDVLGDSKQWPGAGQAGVRFVRAFTPFYARLWVNCQGLPIRRLKRAGWPFRMPSWLCADIDSADVVLSVGGDNYSLDYKIPSPLFGLDSLAIRLGKPVFLWGASIGPFDREPEFLPVVARHLAEMRGVLVRETNSFRYAVDTLGLSNVLSVADPAFTLAREETTLSEGLPTDRGGGVLGLNISPLIERYAGNGAALRGEVAAFVRYAVCKRGMGVLLVPHVVPFDGIQKNNDFEYMRPIFEASQDLGSSVRLLSGQFNAAQLKDVIARCRFFIGARTHATIAALSCCVPTVSIAYSVKAKGINFDLFGSHEMVLPSSEVSTKTLIGRLNWLEVNEQAIAVTLAARIPVIQEQARSAACAVMEATVRA